METRRIGVDSEGEARPAGASRSRIQVKRALFLDDLRNRDGVTLHGSGKFNGLSCVRR